MRSVLIIHTSTSLGTAFPKPAQKPLTMDEWKKRPRPSPAATRLARLIRLTRGQ